MNKDMIDQNHLKQTFTITFTFFSDLLLEIPNILTVKKVSLSDTIHLSTFCSGECMKKIYFTHLMVVCLKRLKKVYKN